MTGFSPRELAIAAGVRRHGVDYLKSLSPVVAAPGRDSWHTLTVQEPFTGAWQRNMEERATTVLTYPTLYACLNRIASDIGKLPFLLKVEDGSGVWRVDKSNTAYWPVLRKPNGYQTAGQFLAAWILSKLIQGNVYVLKGRDERRVVNRLWILDPCSVQPMVSESGEVFYQLNYSTGTNLLPEAYPGSQLIVPASEIIHDRMNCFHHQLIGVPPLCAAHWPAVKNLKILKDSTSFFSNGANPGGILTAPAGMSDEDAQEVKDYWNNSFQGSNAGKVAVIGADMKFTPFAFKAADSQLVEQMRYSDEQVCQPFGIPPFKIGIGSIPAGMKVDDINQLYYSDALQAHIEAIEALLDEGLGISRPMGVELDLEPLLRMDVGKQADVHTKLTSGGIETPNEGRLAFNLPPLEGGDTVYMQQQDFPLDQVRQNKIAAEPEAAPVAPSAETDETPPDDSDERRSLQQENFMMKALHAARAEVFRND
ncbi:phage portal protein [Stenotrophomonas maltophilia]|uniref:phage portal protein n=1 Tax=Stenotrophomonas maltophilia TaxID=40324 RepID=UPI0014512A39|nr:phage portal protein [Stenotrophomonas maltophilia]QJC75427.1 phage portal protein [Stenotrophomonas maltophilia]